MRKCPWSRRTFPPQVPALSELVARCILRVQLLKRSLCQERCNSFFGFSSCIFRDFSYIFYILFFYTPRHLFMNTSSSNDDTVVLREDKQGRLYPGSPLSDEAKRLRLPGLELISELGSGGMGRAAEFATCTPIAPRPIIPSVLPLISWPEKFFFAFSASFAMSAFSAFPRRH